MKMKKLVAILMVFVLFGALAACGTNEPEPTQAQTEAPTTATPTTATQGTEPTEEPFEGDVPMAENVKVTMAGLLNANLASWYVAFEEGHFLERGIDLQFLTVSGGNEAATALASGDVDIAFASLNNFQAAVASGNDQNVIIAITTGNGGEEWYCSHMAMVVHPDSEVKSESDLKGAVIGTQLGGTSELYAREYLLDKGYDPDNDVEWVHINNADQVTAFINGEVDIISSSEPYNTQFQKEVPGAWELVRGGPYYTYASGVMTTKEYYEKNPEIVQKVVTAFAKGCWSTRKDTESAAEILSHWMPGSDVEVMAASLKHVGYDPRLTVNTDVAWEYGLDSQIKSGKLTDRIPMADYTDATFIGQVVENHPEWFEDLNDAELLTYEAMK